MTNRSALALATLADPTRRRIFETLTEHPSAVGDLAARLPVSRPAVSQHLRALREAGLVISEVTGTRHIYRIDPRGLAALRAWLDEHWARALASFADAVPSEQDPP